MYVDASETFVPVARPVPGQLNIHMVPEMIRDVVFHMVTHLEDEGDDKLQAAEIFAGDANLTAAFRAFGMSCASMDKATNPDTDDVLSDVGKGRLLYTVVKLAPGGLPWLAPPCSSWVWMSRRTSKRSSQDIEGDTTNESVAQANSIARLLAEVCQTCYALGVPYIIEQPRTSLLFTYPPMEAMLRSTRARRVAVDLGKAGATSQKPLALWGTAPWLERLAGIVRRRPALSQPRRLTEKKGRFVNGKKIALGRSAAYPRVFGTIVARLHAESIGHQVEGDMEETQVVVHIDSD